MSPEHYARVLEAICAIAATIILLPPVVYLFTTWPTRRDNLLGSLGTASILLYYKQFYRNTKVDVPTACAVFERDFARRYGKRHYLPPLILLTSLTIVTAYAGARTLQVSQKVTPGRAAFPEIAASAMAGAFVWIVADSLARLRRRDLNTRDVYGWSYRLLIAAPFGWALTQILKPDAGVAIAFLLGVFPTNTLITIGRRLAATQLKIADDPVTGQSELESLPSVTKANAERFNDEDVRAIAQLAYSDPVDLAIRTNFDFSYVTDCISQALLWLYVGEKLKTLTVYSLRGAQEVATLMDSLKSTDPLQAPPAKATLEAVATALGMKPQELQTTLEQVSGDPYTEFLVAVW